MPGCFCVGSEDGGCDTGGCTGPATQCVAGWWGNWCQHTCPDKCKGGEGAMCTRDGFCVGYADNGCQNGGCVTAASQCMAGYWGNWCQHGCPDTCSTGKGGVCSRDGFCVGYADNGCDNGGCKGPATQCMVGYWGNWCQHHCPNTCSTGKGGECTRDGYCLGFDSCPDNTIAQHCTSGYYGSTCAKQCPVNCAQKACCVSGYCYGYDNGDYDTPASQCKPGYYGRSCTSRCPTACGSGCLKSGRCSNTNTSTSTSTSTDIVYDNATCSAVPPSPECTRPNGINSCAFYSDCLEKARDCGSDGYALGFGLPMCQAFLAMDGEQGQLSPEARAWMDNVRQCLQDAAVQFIFDGSLTCDEVKHRAFASHIGCYTAPSNDVCDHLSAWGPVVRGMAKWKNLKKLAVWMNAASVAAACAGEYAGDFAQGVLWRADQVSSFAGSVFRHPELLVAATDAVVAAYFHLDSRGSSADSANTYNYNSDGDVDGGGSGSGDGGRGGTGGADDAFTVGTLAALTELGYFAGNLSLASATNPQLAAWANASMVPLGGGGAVWVVDPVAKTVRLRANSSAAFEVRLQEAQDTCSSSNYTACGATGASFLAAVEAAVRVWT